MCLRLRYSEVGMVSFDTQSGLKYICLKSGNSGGAWSPFSLVWSTLDFLFSPLQWRTSGLYTRRGQIWMRDKVEIIQCEDSDALEQAAQRSCECLIPGRVQCQAGWNFEQPGLVEGTSAHGREIETRWSLMSVPRQIIKETYDLFLLSLLYSMLCFPCLGVLA